MSEAICKQARDQLEDILFPPTSDNETGLTDADPRFYPRTTLRRWFTTQNIKIILNCLCVRCKSHLSLLGKDHLADQSRPECPGDNAERIRGTAGNGGAIALFALLLQCDYPMFILQFIEEQYDDAKSIESYCLAESIRLESVENHWPQLRQRDSSASRKLAAKFLKEVHRFAPPVIADGDFAVYGAKRIMPFYDEKELGHGTFGDVYGFKIHQDYIRLKDIGNSSGYARKQLHRDTQIEDFYREQHNLDLVRQLDDPHIVKIVKSYRKGNSFNIIFPRAKGNLKDCLDEPRHLLGKLKAGPMRQAGMWRQMLGLARALDRIINYEHREDPSQTSSAARKILGYHFDLKPANVLVYDNEDGEDNILKISDFGQAKFKDQTGGDSRTTNIGGTENYAPPEASTNRHRVLNTKYDVWSLGCIFTEMVTFFLKDHQGVKDFAAVRLSSSGGWLNYRYFDETRMNSGRKRFILRPSVKTWINELLQNREECTDAENRFLTEIKDLLFKMLDVDQSRRHTSTDVHLELKRILDDNEEPLAENTNPEPNFHLPPEVGIDGQTLGQLRRVFARHSQNARADFLHATLHASAKSHMLELTTVIQKHPYTWREPLRELHIVPQYAIRKGYHKQPNEWDFRIITSRVPHESANGFDYQIGNIAEARILQGFLTGHEIRQSYELESLNYTYYQPPVIRQGQQLKKVLHGFLHKKETHQDKEDTSSQHSNAGRVSEKEDGPFTVQVWREVEHAPDLLQRISDAPQPPVRPPRMPLPEEVVPSCRVVIFRSTNIFVIPFSDATRLEKLTEGQPPSSTVVMCPQKPVTQPYVIAASLLSIHRPCVDPPSIPLDLSELRRSERIQRKDFKVLELKFKVLSDAEGFRSEYLALKQRWDNERIAKGLD